MAWTDLPEGMTEEHEIKSRRSSNSRVFKHPNDETSYTCISHVRDKYWEDLNESDPELRFKEIDVNFVASDIQGYEWMNSSHSISFYLKSNLNRNNSVVVNRHSSSIGTTPVCMAYAEMEDDADLDIGSVKFQLLQNPSNSIGSIVYDYHDSTGPVEARVVYENVYTNVDIMYGSQQRGLKEFIRLKDKSSLPDPTLFGLDPALTQLIFVTQLDLDGIHRFKDINDKDITLNRNIEQDICFGDDTSSKIFIPELFGWEEPLENVIGSPNVQVYQIKKRLIEYNGNIYMVHGITYYELQAAAQWPFIVDDSFYFNPAATADDSTVWWCCSCYGVSSGWSNTGTYMYVGEQYSYYSAYYWYDVGYSFHVLFRSVTVDRYETVDYSHVALYGYAKYGTPANNYLLGVDDSTPSNPTDYSTWWSYCYNIHTTASVNISSNVNVSAWNYPVTTSIAQEIVNRSDWSNGNNMAFVSGWWGTCPGWGIARMLYRTYDYSTSYDPYLRIDYTTYTPLNSSGTLSLGGSTVGQSFNIRIGAAATDTISLNDTAVRALIGKASGAQNSMSEYYGA